MDTQKTIIIVAAVVVIGAGIFALMNVEAPEVKAKKEAMNERCLSYVSADFEPIYAEGELTGKHKTRVKPDGYDGFMFKFQVGDQSDQTIRLIGDPEKVKVLNEDLTPGSQYAFCYVLAEWKGHKFWDILNLDSIVKLED